MATTVEGLRMLHHNNGESSGQENGEGNGNYVGIL